MAEDLEMSMYWMEHGEPETLVYDDGRTKQAFKSQTDINRILAMANKTGAISHLAKYEGMYGDFEEFDFLAAQLQIRKAGEIFEALPAELRREFQQSPNMFFEFVNDPKNKDRLSEIFPVLAEPGSYPLDMSMRTPPGATTDPDRVDPDAEVVPPAAPEKSP